MSEDVHERNVRLHGRPRADYARWAAFVVLCEYMIRCESRRKERALLEALDALERARQAEEGVERWGRMMKWCARRVDGAAAKLSRRAKLVTRIDFSPAPELVDYGEAIELDDGGIEW